MQGENHQTSSQKADDAPSFSTTDGGMNRRDFLRAGAIATTAGAAACAYDPRGPAEKVLPYVVNPENVQPGLATHYAGVCHGCASACGLIARNKDGRVVHVEGNPDHPNGPGLCTRGHFDLVAAYGPDRAEGPRISTANTTWEEATTRLNDAISAAKAAGKSVAWLGRYRTGSAAALLDQLAGRAGFRRVHWEAQGVESLLAATRQSFGVDELPAYELADARVIVSFGLDFLGTAFDSMRTIKGWAAAKNPDHGGFVARTIAITPRVGLSESQVDHWIAPKKPGSEGKVALALAKLCAEAKGYTGPAAAMLAGIDVAAASQASGIAEEKLKEIAGWLAAAELSVVLPGGSANAGTDASGLAAATLLCNEVLGNVGRSVTFRGLKPGQVNSFADVKALLDDAKAGKIGVLFVDGLDPIHQLPAEVGAAEALAAVDQLVQFADEDNDSTTRNTLLLPTGSGLEGWSDANVEAGVHVLGQPGMVPLKHSRSLGDVLLKLVQAHTPQSGGPVLGLLASPAASLEGLAHASAGFADFIRGRWTMTLAPAEVADDASRRGWWSAVQARGLFLSQPAAASVAWVGAQLPTVNDALAGDGKVLVLFPSPMLADGRWANVPWAQEIPDPISTYFWNSWAEINPKTAEALGLDEKDLVEVKTATGSVKVGWFGSPGVPDDTVAVILGNGRTTGRYAGGRGDNGLKLVGASIDAGSGALATFITRATVSRVGGDSGVHPLCGSMHQDGRKLANNVNPEDVFEKKDGGAESIVNIHHPPVDSRVSEAGPVDMYPEPQHPTYRFSMVIDTNSCNGCGACVAACSLENNIPFVGPDQLRKGRTMTWIRMDRFWEGAGENPDVRYLPALCQHCSHAPCEGVCPVLATYHNLDGLNAMIYNRCVGTRYCANNCPYTARRFNYHTWEWPESYHLMLNPDLSTREMGVMEKCTFCVQRTRSAKDAYRDLKETVPDAALRKLTACAAACPSGAITFGNWKDGEGEVRRLGESPRAYTMLGELNTKPGVRYLSRVSHTQPRYVAHGAGHGASGETEGGEHGGGHDAPVPAHGGGGHGAVIQPGTDGHAPNPKAANHAKEG